jgi:hypothetical protein
MNGIEDVSEVMPAWMRGGEKAKTGMTKEGARAFLLALVIKVVKAGAVGGLGIPMSEVEKLAK